MKKSQNTQSKFTRLIGIAIVLISTHPNLSPARPRTVVEVTIAAERHVCRPHTMKDKDIIFLPLKLTYQIPEIPSGQPLTITIPRAVGEGAGLVVNHLAPDGTVTTQTLPPQPWWSSNAETLQIKSSTVPTSFNIWVLPGMHIDFSRLGIYHISYVHPWAKREEDPNSILFRSNTLTIACVTGERRGRLYKMLRENPELAFASYCFKNPPLGEQEPKYRRAKYLWTIDEAISIGAKQDKVLFLLGSPDTVGYATPGLQKINGYDEEWWYETSPVGGYYVQFKNGCVVTKGKHADWGG